MSTGTITKSKDRRRPTLVQLKSKNKIRIQEPPVRAPGIALITSYPPRACGIATYSTDLEKALKDIFGTSISISVFPLETGTEKPLYQNDISRSINTDDPSDYAALSCQINSDPNIELVVVQHEFGLFSKSEAAFKDFLEELNKPVTLTFHTILPDPSPEHRKKVTDIVSACDSIIVMTHRSAVILMEQYDAPEEKINVIPHGTHLVHHENKETLKRKYGLSGKKILSTFGLLGPGKSIETTIRALPEIIAEFPDVLFLVLGRTHPSLVKERGEEYRDFLKKEVKNLGLEDHVQFVNRFLPLEELLEYLQLTDIYLFTSKDPNQAVSGTFAYALSCGCPVISTPIPHALELLKSDAGVTFDFENSQQLQHHIFDLLRDDERRNQMSHSGLATSAASAWENSAIAHGKVFEKICNGRIRLKYLRPPIRMDHIRKMTTDIGIIQFSKINQPDIESGYTLDDNARALIAFCRHYELTGNEASLEDCNKYFNFVFRCFRPDGRFLNYVDKNCKFTEQNLSVNLEDAAGRAIWSIGYLLSVSHLFPFHFKHLEDKALFLLEQAFPKIESLRSPRAIAFAIKGLYYCTQGGHSPDTIPLIEKLADRLVDLYDNESDTNWHWFERNMTYGNSVLPHALILAYLATQNPEYREVAKESFDFLLSRIFAKESIRVISNQNWLRKDDIFDLHFKGGEQPIDVAYTILALKIFHIIFPEERYDEKMNTAFNWFLGQNPLHQTIYNPCTSGCYDGLELTSVNLNQGAESSISYLLARMAFENLPLR